MMLNWEWEMVFVFISVKRKMCSAINLGNAWQ